MTVESRGSKKVADCTARAMSRGDGWRDGLSCLFGTRRGRLVAERRANSRGLAAARGLYEEAADDVHWDWVSADSTG